VNGQKFELYRRTRRLICLYIYNIILISSDDGINSAGDTDTECVNINNEKLGNKNSEHAVIVII
jgi:hypothetical protein